MKWSQLKKRIETTFADSMAGRVAVWTTRYRNSHDQEGEAWITVDRQTVWSSGTLTFFNEEWKEKCRLRTERGSPDYHNPQQHDAYFQVFKDAERNVRGRGLVTMQMFQRSLGEYLNRSIDDALVSDDVVIRAIAMLDKRTGKRRLARIDASGESPLVMLLHKHRCDAEGLDVHKTAD